MRIILLTSIILFLSLHVLHAATAVMRDPFESIEWVHAHENQTVNELHRYTLDRFKFVGRLKDHERAWGLILTPSGRVYPVKCGDILGDHEGIVAHVGMTSIIVRALRSIAGKKYDEITRLGMKSGGKHA